MSNQWTVVVGDQIKMRKNEHSFRLTWQVRHLILRVSYFPHTERLQMKPRYPVPVYPVFRIPPDFEDQLGSGLWLWKKRYVYRDVKQFEDETTYRKTEALEPLAVLWSNPVNSPW